MIISKIMYAYLKSYVKWIERGALNVTPYSREWGLCLNAVYFTDDNECALLRAEFKILFNEGKLDLQYPFGEENYWICKNNRTQHEDPIRLQWIKNHIEEYEKFAPYN